MIIKHRQDVYVRRCRWQYAAFYRNVHTWHFSHSSSLSPPIVFVQPEFVLMGQQCNTENFYSSAPHCKILRVVNKVCPITLPFSYTGSTRALWILWPALDIAHPGIQIECEWLTSNTSQESWKLAKYGWIQHWAHSIPVFLGAISLTRVTCAILKHLKQMQTSADASNSQPFLHLLAKFILQ